MQDSGTYTGWASGFCPNLGMSTSLGMPLPQLPEEWLGLGELFLAWNWGPRGLREDGEGGGDLTPSQVHRVKISRIHPHGFEGEPLIKELSKVEGLGFNGAE